MIFIKTQLVLSVCFQNLVLVKGTFLSESPPLNSTGFIFALCEYLVSCFQLENSYERDILLQKIMKIPYEQNT